ncbi:MAG: PrsW family intramembrane metalloprotease [Candidatus Zixiibacteriota bacterium]|nr:MAG: PrsW family intramembrane metalloprotease [candidate division Zixibacteria bacterium]
MIIIVKIVVSLMPVFAFLMALIYLDSYKLTRLQHVLRTILLGGIIATICMILNRLLLDHLSIPPDSLSRYVAPVVEETAKAVYLIYMIKRSRLGFLVDSAIHGFAIGAGFAFVENSYYLYYIESSNILLWIFRGFGTAIMHGSTMVIFGVVSKSMTDRSRGGLIAVFLPGIIMAMLIHSLYNHFIFSPLISTLMLVIFLPVLTILIFVQSEKATRNWLGVGMDVDIDLLEMINSGRISETPVGTYLESLKTRFPGPVVADMLCMLRLHLELAMRAKGILLMRQTGFEIQPDPEIPAKFDELRYLEKSIGKVGKMTISPFLSTSSRDLWQIYMLKS